MNKQIPKYGNYLSECPICSYSLKGLPDKHKCPECGADYDRDSEVIARIPGAWFVRGFIALMFLVLILVVVSVFLSGYYEVLIFVFIMAASVVQTLNKHLLSKAKAILSLKGVELLRKTEEPEIVEWKDVNRVDWPKWSLNISFWSSDDELLRIIPSDFFGTTAQARRFVSSAQRWLRLYKRMEAEEKVDSAQQL